MSVGEEWRADKYQQVFDDEIRGLVRRSQSDPDCKIEDLEGILRNLYIRDGADIDGRGSLQDTILAATIAAYEHYIANWKSKIPQ
jgi:hypothetical protein